MQGVECVAAKEMFWGDAGLHRLEMAKLDGTGRTVLLTDTASQRQYRGMVLTATYLYVADFVSRLVALR